MANIVKLIVLTLLVFGTSIAQAQIYLDADTPSTGSDLGTNPLVTPYGTITFVGDIETSDDDDTVAAGSTGFMFDGAGSNPAERLFYLILMSAHSSLFMVVMAEISR